MNATKCPELGQLLYDWFIDCLQIYKARVNAGIFLWKARHLQQRLIAAGYDAEKMPSLAGGAGRSWFLRWRKRFKVKSRRWVKHLKVPPKVKEQLREFERISAIEDENAWASMRATLAISHNDDAGQDDDNTGYKPQEARGEPQVDAGVADGSADVGSKGYQPQ